MFERLQSLVERPALADKSWASLDSLSDAFFILSGSLEARSSLAVFKDSSSLDLSSGESLSPFSFKVFSMEKIKPSSWFLFSTSCFLCLSSSSDCCASFTALSMSSSERLVEEVITISVDFCVPRSFA